MKKSLFVAAVDVLAFVACKKSETKEDGSKVDSAVSEN